MRIKLGNILGEKGPIGERGDQGLQGYKGNKGLPGISVPIGGTTNSILVKKSDLDYDVEWKEVSTYHKVDPTYFLPELQNVIINGLGGTGYDPNNLKSFIVTEDDFKPIAEGPFYASTLQYGHQKYCWTSYSQMKLNGNYITFGVLEYVPEQLNFQLKFYLVTSKTQSVGVSSSYYTSGANSYLAQAVTVNLNEERTELKFQIRDTTRIPIFVSVADALDWMQTGNPYKALNAPNTI